MLRSYVTRSVVYFFVSMIGMGLASGDPGARVATIYGKTGLVQPS